MDAVTYPHARVVEELDEHWLTACLDVTESGSSARAFGVAAIPTAVAVSAEGAVLGVILGFVEPEKLVEELGALRTNRPR